MELIYTDGSDKRFVDLCHELDDFLNEIVGGEKQRDKYNQYNTLKDIDDVILTMVKQLVAAVLKDMMREQQR